MKLTMVGSYPLDRVYGGVSMHIVKLAQHLTNIDDIELHILVLGNKSTLFKKDNSYIHVVKWSHFPILDVYRLKKEILKINPNIVHAQGTYFPYSTAASLLSNKYKTLITVHGSMSQEIKFKKGIDYIAGKLIAIPLEKFAFSKIQYVITCSPAMEKMVSRSVNAKVYVIPNGMDYEEVRMCCFETIRHPSVLFVGLLEKVKGADVLIRAIPKIKEKIPQICVYIAGEGSQKRKLIKLSKELSVDKNIEFLGYISGDKKNYLYSSVDVCCVPSMYESFGIVLLEAMSFGKPVIASNVGGIPYILEDGKTGFLFELGNVDDLAEKIINLILDTNLKTKLGKAGFEKVKDFNWKVIADRTVSVYKEVLAK